jgi:putative transposase
MPRKNTLKEDTAESYYHVYARGNSKRKIFVTPEDYDYFISLLKRYLSNQEAKNVIGVSYPNFYHKIEVISFVLMPGYFHLLMYQYQQAAMSSLMRSLMTSYSMYFNKKYKHTGSLFESRYRAVAVTEAGYVEHISRYVHLVPKQWNTYQYSSLQYYLHQNSASWIRPDRVLELFKSPTDYQKFLEDHEGHRQVIEILKHELADNS